MGFRRRHNLARVAPPVCEPLDPRRLLSGTLGPAGPDFTATAPVVTLTGDAGAHPPSVSFDVPNSGDAAAFEVSVYVSPDPALSPDDALVRTAGPYYPTYYTSIPVTLSSLDLPTTPGATWYPIVVVHPTGTLADVNPDDNTVVGQPFTTPARSLTLTSLSFTTYGPIVPGDAFYHRLAVQTAGYFPSDSIKVRYYLTADDTIDPATDPLIQTATYSILTGPSDAPAPAIFDGVLAFPVDLPAGTYHLAAVPDDDPTTEAAVFGPDVTLAVPDPAASAFAVTPPSGRAARAGDSPAVSYTVSNATDTATRSLRVAVYLSTDATFSPDDALVWNDVFWTLAANSSTPSDTSFMIPADLAGTGARTYYPILVIDPFHESADADRSNNVLVADPVTVVTPHFTLVSLSAPATVDRPGPFTVTGTALVTGFTRYDNPINFNLTLTDGTTIIGSSTLGPDPTTFDTADATTPVLIPFSFSFDGYDAPLRPGTYTLNASPSYWDPDPDGATVEVDPSFVAPTVAVTAESSYYLTLSAPAFVGTVYDHEPATFSFTVTNLGGQPSPATTVSLSFGDGLAHALGYPDTTETPLDPITVDPIPAHSSRTITVSRTMTGVGWFSNLHFKTDATVPAFFDPDSSHDAYLHYNPTFRLPDDPRFPYPPVLADASLLSVSSASSVTAGSALRVSSTPGWTDTFYLGAAPQFAVRYVLSANDTAGDADDIVLGTAIFTGATPAQDLSSFAVPANTRPGTYRLLAMIDPDNAVAESDETNNIFSANTVTVVAPTLAGSLAVSTASLRVGTPARLTLSLTSLSAQPVRRKYAVSYYLSADPTFSSDDALFCKQTIDATLAAGKPKAFLLTAKIPTTGPLGSRYLIAVVDPATGLKSPASHLEVASKVLTLVGPHVAASVLSVQSTSRLDTAKVTVRVLNDGTAPYTGGPMTLRLLGDDKLLLTSKKSVSLKPGKYVDYTFTVRRSPLSTFTVTLA